VVPTATTTGHHIVLQGAHAAADHASAANHIVGRCDAATAERRCTSASNATLLLLLLLLLCWTLLLTWRRLCGTSIGTSDVVGDVDGLAFW
jgi:hypothetical protein